jgi:hypothetical protein
MLDSSFGVLLGTLDHHQLGCELACHCGSQLQSSKIISSTGRHNACQWSFPCTCNGLPSRLVMYCSHNLAAELTQAQQRFHRGIEEVGLQISVDPTLFHASNQEIVAEVVHCVITRISLASRPLTSVD